MSYDSRLDVLCLALNLARILSGPDTLCLTLTHFVLR